MRRNMICLGLALVLVIPAQAQEWGTASRGWFVMRLWEWAGSVPYAVSDTFLDVEANSEWMEPVAWAESWGLIQGDGCGFFYPDAPLTYGHLELILSRYDTCLDRAGGIYCPNALSDAPVTVDEAERVIEKFYRDGAFAPSLLLYQKQIVLPVWMGNTLFGAVSCIKAKAGEPVQCPV